MKIKTPSHECSNPKEMVAKEYIEKFLNDVRRWSPEGIDYVRHLEAIANFNTNYSKKKNLHMKSIIQGMNEIDLAVNVYNTINSEYGWN
jgi:hypothetical protein